MRDQPIAGRRLTVALMRRVRYGPRIITGWRGTVVTRQGAAVLDRGPGRVPLHLPHRWTARVHPIRFPYTFLGGPDELIVLGTVDETPPDPDFFIPFPAPPASPVAGL